MSGITSRVEELAVSGIAPRREPRIVGEFDRVLVASGIEIGEPGFVIGAPSAEAIVVKFPPAPTSRTRTRAVTGSFAP